MSKWNQKWNFGDPARPGFPKFIYFIAYHHYFFNLSYPQFTELILPAFTMVVSLHSYAGIAFDQ
jgi:hypothetical protein